MTASILDGTHVASEIKQSIKQQVINFIQQKQRAPGLAVVLIGDDPASHTYVNHKRKACLELGFRSFEYNLVEQTTETELLNVLNTLNHDTQVDGIIVQLPLPKHINTEKILEAIIPRKDVDGFHPYNFGRLAQGNPSLRPCTPFGIITLLNYYNLNLAGKHAVIVGASNIVGRPMAFELLLAKATVTICHKDTVNLEKHVRCADILVVATGQPDLINISWLHKDMIIIDVGMHRCHNGKLRGEIDFKLAKDLVAWITPVPGGVGPMTICMLLQNTLLSALLLQSV